MKPKTEEFLYVLLWSAEQLTRPTYRNLSESFESWAYRKGLLRQIERLRRAQMIEAGRSRATRRIYRLSEKGRLHVLGGRDPEAWWSRKWDGRWRVVLFDLPRSESGARKRLHRRMRAQGFGYLQHSVWITPDPLPREFRKLSGRGDDLTTLIALEGRPGAGENNRDIVRQAWDFDGINERYERLLSILKAFPNEPASSETGRQCLRDWAADERDAWLAAISVDPLLPEALLPRGYLGRKVWRRRQDVLGRAGRVIS